MERELELDFFTKLTSPESEVLLVQMTVLVLKLLLAAGVRGRGDVELTKVSIP